MKDLTIKGTGNSRFLKSVENFKAQYPSYDDFAAALVVGTLPVDFNGLNPDGVEQLGTPLNKNTLLTDETAEAIGLTSEDPTVNEALAELDKSRYRVGDTLETTRTDLGDSWALCNFEPFDPDSYPELAKVATPWIASYLGYAPVVPTLETDIVLTKSNYPPVYTELDGVQIISGPSNGSYATDTKILWSTDNFKTYTQTRSAISNSSQRGSGVFKANGYYFHVGYESSSAGTPYIYVSYSTDLITWTVGTTKDFNKNGESSVYILDVAYIDNEYYLFYGYSKNFYYIKSPSPSFKASDGASQATIVTNAVGYARDSIVEKTEDRFIIVIFGTGASSSTTPLKITTMSTPLSAPLNFEIKTSEITPPEGTWSYPSYPKVGQFYVDGKYVLLPSSASSGNAGYVIYTDDLLNGSWILSRLPDSTYFPTPPVFKAGNFFYSFSYKNPFSSYGNNVVWATPTITDGSAWQYVRGRGDTGIIGNDYSAFAITTTDKSVIFYSTEKKRIELPIYLLPKASPDDSVYRYIKVKENET